MSKQGRTLVVEVAQVEGHCPVHRPGDRYQIQEGFKLVSDGPVCMHALQSLGPYYVALSRGIDPRNLGLAGPDGAAYVQCLDPVERTGGGTVVLRISAVLRNP
jgi:uncharacterized repeat protein (TIGR04076 family)